MRSAERRLTCRDADVKEEGFLEYINQLVMTGEVAGLFPKEEMDAMLNDVRPVFKRESPGTPLNRHECLCLSPLAPFCTCSYKPFSMGQYWPLRRFQFRAMSAGLAVAFTDHTCQSRYKNNTEHNYLPQECLTQLRT